MHTRPWCLSCGPRRPSQLHREVEQVSRRLSSSEEHDVSTEEIRAGYKPDKVRVLFIGESAPPSGKTFFYNGDSRLCRFWKTTFETVLERQFATASAFLLWFKRQGFFLDDLLLVPKRRSNRRKELELMWRSGIEPLADRISQCQPAMAVAVIKGPAECIGRAIKMSGVRLDYRIVGFPFPGKHMRTAEREAACVTEELRERGLL